MAPVELKEQGITSMSPVLQGHAMTAVEEKNTVSTGSAASIQEQTWQASHPNHVPQANPITEIASGLLTYFIDYFRYMPATTHWLILFTLIGVLIYYVANYTPIPRYFNTYRAPQPMEAVDQHLISGVLKALPHRQGLNDSRFNPSPAAFAGVNTASGINKDVFGKPHSSYVHSTGGKVVEFAPDETRRIHSAKTALPAVTRHSFETAIQSIAVPGDQGPRIKHLVER